MSEEVAEFAKNIGATDLKQLFEFSEFHNLFRRRNYFLLRKNVYLIVKISRSEIRPFWGLGKKFFDLFNKLTEKEGNYYFVALVSDKSGWVISKKEILSYISDGSLSYSANQNQYKINNYNLRDNNGFSSTEAFLKKIR